MFFDNDYNYSTVGDDLADAYNTGYQQGYLDALKAIREGLDSAEEEILDDEDRELG